MLGEVVSCDPRGTRTASIRVSGGRVHTRVLTCDENLEIGDKVIVVRMMGLDRLAVLGRIVSQHGSDLSQRGVLAPPSNFGAYSFGGVTYCQWDTYPGEDISWEVERALQADKSDAESVLVSRGSYYFYECDPGTTVYFRARAIRWLGPNNRMYSGWSSWAGVTCDEHEVPNLLVELTNRAGKQVGADWVVVIDTANASSFKTTVVAGDENVIGVAHEIIEDGATGLVCISGQHSVYVDGAVGIGDYLVTSATEGRADGAVAASPGCFGRSLTAKDVDDKVVALIGPAGGAGSGMLAHNLLSAWHTDTVADSPVQGDLAVGNATPAWTRLPRGAADEVLRMNTAGTDPMWGELPISTIDSYARGDIIRGGAIDWEAYAAKADGQILVGDGVDINSVPVSQDVDLDNTGVATVVGIRARAVGAGAPADGQVYVWVDAVSEWQPGAMTGGGSPTFRADGVLVVTTGVGEAYISTADATIEYVYIHCGTPGTAGSTIVDVNKNGVTIFTNQANRPTLAWNDADGVAKSGIPDVVDLAENDVLTIDIDQVATGAADLSVVIAMSSSGGGGGGGAPLDAKYVTTTENASLLDEIVLPQLGYYNPDTPPATPGAYDDEFDDDAIAGVWGFSGGYDAAFDLKQSNGALHASESIYHGYLLLQGDHTVTRAFTPAFGDAWTLVTKFSLGYDPNTNESWWRLKVEQDATHYYEVRVGRKDVAIQARTVYNNGGSVGEGDKISAGYGTMVYVMITKDTGTNFSAFVSTDGLCWIPIEINRNLNTWTSVAQFSYHWPGAGETDGLLAIEFVRYFTTEAQFKIGKDV